ncbi:MAG: penicillin acylase family protein [Acidobacteria bacterium]|nr:penicillin acylase family protein [Acidobacteriota bacterium]
MKPQMGTESVRSPWLREEVKIRRDERGIPFIEATNEADLYFAQGYATAEDRLWQMDFLRRTARGELAEVTGSGALEVDKLHRIYGFRNVAETLWKRASDHTRKVLDAYAHGVNAYIDRCDAKSLPLEFQVLQYQPKPWAPVDSLALGKLFAEKLSFTVEADLLRALLSDLPPERVASLLPETSPLDLIDGRQSAAVESREFSHTELSILTEVLKRMRRARAVTNGDSEIGSNSWVVGGDKTVSGKPMLASDPHLPPTSPSIWHIVHLSTGDQRVAGVAVPGVPGVMIGHNKWIAWGITNLCPDVQDLYIEQFDTENPRSYRTPDGWREAEIRTEEIAVRSGPNGSRNSPTKVEVKVTRHGPVIFQTDSIGLALRWTALDDDIIDLDTFLGLNHARNWDDFTTAVSGYGGPPQNFTYADTAGHIGYYAAGRIPVRKSGDGSVPYDGTTDEGEWIGWVPFEELPHAFDPPSAMIVSANQRIVDHAYPHHLTHNWRVPYRARRIHERLHAESQFDVEGFCSIQADTYSYPDAIFATEIVKLGQRSLETSREWSEIVDQLSGWNGYSDTEATVLPLVVEMRKAFRNRILAATLGSERAQLYEWRNEGTFVDRLIIQRPKSWLPAEFADYESLLLACYREAVNKLTEKLGPDRDRWTWGRLAPVRFPHPLEKLGPIGAKFATKTFLQNTGGSMPTVNAGARVSMRFIVDLSDLDATRLCLPLGESGVHSSVQREDQLDEWRNVTPRLMPFNERAIARATRSVLVLKAC